MKVNLFFFLARFGFGGAGNSVYRLATSLSKKKYKIFVICLNTCAYEKKFNKNGIKVFKLNAKKLIFSIFQLKSLIKTLIKKKTKNILISNINYTNIFCALIFWKNKDLRLIGIERTPLKELEIYFGLIDSIKKFILRILLKISYHRVDQIICNSNYMSNYLKKRYKFNSKVIYPPSLVKKSKKEKISFFDREKRLNIITICRLSKEKNLEEILKAIDILKKENIFFNVVGDGPEKENLKNLAKSLDINHKIKFFGQKSKIKTLLKRSHLYINSSYFEGFPNSVVEAASAGLPIISSQSHGGINEILSGGKGGTIYKNLEDLKKSIEKFANNPQIFINKSKFTQKKILKFSLKNHVTNFDKMLNDI